MRKKVVSFLLFSTVAMVLNGCGGGGGSSDSNTNGGNSEGNQNPIANAGADRIIYLGTSAIISGLGTDSDGTIVSYEWKSGNDVLANTASFTYEAVALGVETLTLTVMDDDGATDTDTVDVEVVNIRELDPSEILP